ncbi:MAG TPA: hypothetical protein VJK72_04095 [Candidatus Nanoarchaeia archaeon]|nr:hypothetical protein [Candidatus Nanoarchaeia archaeon]
MEKCSYDGKKCRGTIGCLMGICAKKVDSKIDDWSNEHGWNE